MDIDDAGDLRARAFKEWSLAQDSSALLLSEHTAAVAALNTVGIEVEGNLELAQVVNSSMYALISAYRKGGIYGGAPEGLVSTRYFGDAFWDVETWQWPTLLAFWPEEAKACLDYRSSLVDAAAANAKLPLPFYPPNSPPHDGLRFPWHSALAGVEQV